MRSLAPVTGQNFFCIVARAAVAATAVATAAASATTVATVLSQMTRSAGERAYLRLDNERRRLYDVLWIGLQERAADSSPLVAARSSPLAPRPSLT